MTKGDRETQNTPVHLKLHLEILSEYCRIFTQLTVGTT